MSNNLQFLHVLLLNVQWSYNASKFNLHPSAAKLLLSSRPRSQGWVYAALFATVQEEDVEKLQMWKLISKSLLLLALSYAGYMD